MVKMPVASNDKLTMYVTYARFEFALKQAGYLSGAQGDIAHADWSKFAREKALSDMLEAVSTNPDVAGMIADPPKTQIMRGNGFEWQDRLTKPINKVGQLFLAVKAVRDNLFHGGKAGENMRDDSLCRAGVVVMMACLERHAEVRNAFEYKC
jgi:hypothetical protein